MVSMRVYQCKGGDAYFVARDGVQEGRDAFVKEVEEEGEVDD